MRDASVLLVWLAAIERAVLDGDEQFFHSQLFSDIATALGMDEGRLRGICLNVIREVIWKRGDENEDRGS